MRHIKNLGKKIVVAVLTWQLQRLQAKNQIKTVGIVGSYGKTSTKVAIATVLSKHYRVRYQDGNYNDLVTVPLIFFGETMPSLLNPIAWTRLFLRNEKQLKSSYPYDVVILELGTDGPGQIQQFKQYLSLDFAVVTSIAYEHMEFFKDLEAVANEELSVAQFSNTVFVNVDLCDQHYIASLDKPTITFGHSNFATYKLQADGFANNVQTFSILHDGTSILQASYSGVSKNPMYSATAATLIAKQLGMPDNKIITGIANIHPVSGRMQILDGIKNSTILDDTYNSSPSAAKASLELLYGMEAPQRIALLGNMNELGEFSKDAHIEIGEYCNPKKVDLVVTLGPDANTHLAPAARANGCVVKECISPYEAGEYIKQQIAEKAAVLAKGSQNNVYAEEAVKLLLANPEDSNLLVRQSPSWLKKKQTNFS